jgi:cysteine desulfurase
VRQLAAAAHDAGVIFHTDATQVLGKVFLDVAGLGVDTASISGHKIGALKGTGALYVRKGQAITPLIVGGGQESARRSGTQNVAGAVSFAAAAAQAACELEEAEARMRALRDQIYMRAQDIAGIEALVDVEAGSRDYLPNIVCLATPGIESQTSVLRFDSLGVCVSGGSACASHSLAPSHVLSAMGIDSDTAQCELRVSIGNTTMQTDVDAFFDALQQVINWKF